MAVPAMPVSPVVRRVPRTAVTIMAPGIGITPPVVVAARRVVVPAAAPPVSVIGVPAMVIPVTSLPVPGRVISAAVRVIEAVCAVPMVGVVFHRQANTIRRQRRGANAKEEHGKKSAAYHV